MLPWSPCWNTVGLCAGCSPAQGEWKVVHATGISIILESEEMLGPKAICFLLVLFPGALHILPHVASVLMQQEQCQPRRRWLPDPALAAAGAVTLPVADWGGWWANLVCLCPWPEPMMIHAAPPFPFPQLQLLASALFSCFMSLGINCIKDQDSLKASLLVFQNLVWGDFSSCTTGFFPNSKLAQISLQVLCWWYTRRTKCTLA